LFPLSNFIYLFADIILSLTLPGGNPLLRRLVVERPSAEQKSVDKGKRPRVTQPLAAKQTPAVVKPITIVLPPTQQSAAPAQETPRSKKRKDKEHKKDNSSRRSPTRLQPRTTSGDCAVVMDFLKYDLMVSNRVNVKLDNYEAGPYSFRPPHNLPGASYPRSSCWSHMGDELMKKGGEDVEKLKANLEDSVASLKSALTGNIDLAGRNKDLEAQLEANAEIKML